MKKALYILSAFTFINCFIGCNFAPGSYPYVERYEVEISKDELIALVEKFKQNNPDFIVPAEVRLIDGQSDDRDDHWYHVYFYYKKENQIVNTWLRENGSKTTFALNGINDGLQLGNWKMINKDFSSSENKIQKQKFETLILNKILALKEKK